MFRHAVALVLLEAVTRAVLRQRAHQPVARHLGDDRRRRDRHHQTVAADHGLAFAGRVDPVATIDKDVPRQLRQRLHRAGQRPQRGAQDIVAIDSRRRREGHRERRSRADLLEQFLAPLRGQPLGIVDALRDPLGIEHHGRGHHRTRQRTAAGLVAAGHRPDAALDQRALAAKARRRHRNHALGRPRPGRFRTFRESCRDGAQARPAAQPGTRAQFPLFNSGPAQRLTYEYTIQKLVRQMNPAIVADLDARGDHDLPGMVVRIGEISRIAAIFGLVRGLQQRARPWRRRNSSTGSTSSVEPQFQASVTPRNACGRGWSGKRRIMRQLIPRKQPEHRRRRCRRMRPPRRLRETSCAKPERFVERDAGAHVADAERDDGQAWNRDW